MLYYIGQVRNLGKWGGLMRSIPQSIQDKINKQNQTIFDNADPKMQVIVARARASISDSTYFTIEKIRQKEGLSDVAVAARRLKSYGKPDRLYCIHLDNGTARTMHREYPDRLKNGWQNDFDIGPSKGVSIVFDGRWNLTPRITWGLKTDLVPWLFWIDNSNNLQCRLWDSATTIQLATGVSKIDCARGWVPAQTDYFSDQGLIVAYVKTDGKVYYRNYSLQNGGLTIWELEKEVTELGTGNTGVRLFRTNDFRVGFIAENPIQNKMAITKRNYAGMSVPPENLTAKINAKIDLTPLEFIGIKTNETLTAGVDCKMMILWGSPENSFIDLNNTSTPRIDEQTSEEYQDWGYRVELTLEHGITTADASDFKLTDSEDVIYNVTEILEISKKKHLLVTSNLNNAVGELRLTLKGGGNTKGEADQAMYTFSASFTPNNLVPTLTPIPEVEAIYNE